MKRDITKKMCSFVHFIFEFINDLKLTSFTTLINLSLVILMLLLLFLNKRKSFKHSKFTKRPSDADWRNVLVSTGIDSIHVSVYVNAFKTRDDRYEICLLIRIVDETFCTISLFWISICPVNECQAFVETFWIMINITAPELVLLK